METVLLGHEIKRIYRGANGRCCCGCSGKYREDSSAISRGIKEIARAQESGEELDIGSNYIALEKGSRILIAYFG